ncbi:MAG: chromosome partitioning protein ParB [Tenericutes bacterium HGW-Tenericutes-4]|nr:MAG: chromosome partitioning protein ParB [Tenericutes bacterium HGW-Tenericutes-4]
MSTIKKGLGRGLDSLFSIYNDDEQQVVAVQPSARTEFTQGVEDVKVGDIDPNKNQPRKNFDEEALKELSESIKNHGVIQPIIVIKKDERYMVIAGERRWRASKLAGLATIPAIVKNYSEKEIKEVSIIENLQREDLNPVEAARAIKELMDEYGWTQEVVATRLGKSRPVIANTIRLLQLQPEVIKLIEDGKLSAGHARSLVVVTDRNAQIKLAQLACTKKITVRDMENAVKKQLGEKTKGKTKKEQSPELKQLIGDMQRVFSTKVTALGTAQRGRIYIDYYNADDLERIYELVEVLKKN